MESTNLFKKTIKNYLDRKAMQDPIFAQTYSKKGKSIEQCIQYILTTVRKSGKCGFCDEEIFGMAVHYYDEDNVKIDKNPNCTVVVNTSVDGKVETEKPAKVVPMKPKKKAKEDVGQLQLF